MVSRLHWNPRLHLELGKELLYFWRVGFPTYNRERIRPELLRLFQEHEIRSYACYEMMGLHDLIVKGWLPTAYREPAFRKRLREQLNPRVVDPFHVDATVRHWPWGEQQPPREPTQEVIDAGLSDDEIRRINSGKLPPQVAREYVDKDIIVRVRRAPGVKFVVVVTTPEPLSTTAGDWLQNRLCELVDEARSIREKSLYVGTGFSRFVLLGRVPYPKLHQVGAELTEKINSDLIPAAYGARTDTYVSGIPDLLAFQDHLPAGPPVVEATREPIEEYLSREEGTTLEIKGSAFTSLHEWLLEEADKPARSPEMVEDGVLKAMTAFLNTDGGVLLIGAVDDRYEGRPRLSGVPRVGKHYCLGVEQEYSRRGGWDAFERRLHEAIKAQIQPGPVTPWYTIASEEVGGRTLAVITVRPPDRDWYYLYPRGKKPPRFYIREGNRSRPLDGPEADHYRASKRRGTRIASGS